MPVIMNMPKIGVNMTDATIVAWMAKEGDTVKEGDHLLDAETDKAVQEIYAAVSGRLTRILAAEGTQVLCQEPIAEFAALDEQPQADAIEAAVAPAAGKQRIPISPLAKKLAQDLGIAIHDLQPAQPGDRVARADVMAHAAVAPIEAAPAAQPMPVPVPVAKPQQAGTMLPYTGIRKRIGDRMTESWQTKPAVALTLHADVGRLVEWRESMKKAGHAVSYNDLIVLIAARALREHPALNSRLTEAGIGQLPGIHIGVAMDTEKGLVVPVIRDADRKNLREISLDLMAKAAAVRAGRAAVEDLSGGTFTITNLGMYEIEQFTPIINPPECCILALGAIIREPVATQHDTIVIQSRMQLTLVFDHRIVDGAPAARFLQRVKHLVQCPMELMS